jgi:hypothetical protein
LAEGARDKHDQYHAILGARVDPYEVPQLDLDTQLLVGFPVSRRLDRLAEIDETARERPAAAARIEPTAQEDHAVLVIHRDRTRYWLGVEVGGVAAVGTDDRSRERDLGRLSAARTKASLGQRGVDRRVHPVDATGPGAARPGESRRLQTSRV